VNKVQIRTAGFDGFLVTFGEKLEEAANRAALAFRAAVDEAGWRGVRETSTSLVSTYLRFDPHCVDHAEMRGNLERLLGSRDWHAVPLPKNRRFWTVPVVFGTDLAPQFEEAAGLAGMPPDEAVASLTSETVRVQTIGFAPGMPYLGELPEAWNIPRQTTITSEIPAGGLCVAIRQLVLFPNPTPTGWRQVGKTAFQLFRPESDTPFVLRPGDEVRFRSVSGDELSAYADDPNGGATMEMLS